MLIWYHHLLSGTISTQGSKASCRSIQLLLTRSVLHPLSVVNLPRKRQSQRMANDNMPLPAIRRKKKAIKVIVIGDQSVGKTSLLHRFCKGEFSDIPCKVTAGVDFESRSLLVDDEEINIHFWDTAGQEKFHHTNLVKQYYRNAHAIILVYDVSQKETFDSLPKWIEKTEDYCSATAKKIPRILVGNKCDKDAEVSTKVAIGFADYNNMPLYEVSVKLDSQSDKIEAIFQTLASKLKEKLWVDEDEEIIRLTSSSTLPSPKKGCCESFKNFIR